MTKNMGFPVQMSQCFWCGEHKNEILLGTRVVKDVDRIPQTVVCNYDPCDSCKTGMEQGIALIEATEKPRRMGQPPIQEGAHGTLYPTGRYLVVRESSIDNFINDPAMAETVKKMGKTFIDPEAFHYLLSSRDKQEGHTDETTH